ncbi:hypothetical protein RvY_05999 [Ramazzottius varieornatus]|uniref:Uncharacterized protein n=1 Tax=Ramazzottius varieornatus TaxID=947166 RepID=A0A1D1UX17_RAMVA|nr:hypothetical protein RvY_05999 [Ramazzottius varieornatus]
MISVSTIQAEMFGQISAGQQPHMGISTLVGMAKQSFGGDKSLYLPSHHEDLFASYTKEKDRSEWLAYRSTDGAMCCYHCVDHCADHPQDKSVRRETWCNFLGSTRTQVLLRLTGRKSFTMKSFGTRKRPHTPCAPREMK